MIKFGIFDSLILYEVLGDLLDSHQSYISSARSYLMAGYYSNDEDIYDKYKLIASEVLSIQKIRGISISGRFSFYVEGMNKINKIEAQLMKEVNEAEKYIEKIRKYEIKWISNELDIEQEFNKKFYNPGLLTNVINFFEGF